MNAISQGYKIPFFLFPTPFSKANNASARSNSAFVSEAVNDLLLEEIFCSPDIFYPLSISTRTQYQVTRLILDLRHVNAFIYKQSSSVKTCPWPLRFSTRCIIYLNLIRRQVTITLKFSQSTGDNVSHLLGILALGSSDFFQFYVLPFGLPSTLFLPLPRFSSRFSRSV